MESGLYSSADDVVSAALGLLEGLDPDLERELADMYERVRIGTQQADAGMFMTISPNLTVIMLFSSLSELQSASICFQIIPTSE